MHAWRPRGLIVPGPTHWLLWPCVHAQARNANDAARCVASAASMVRATLTWRRRYSFFTPEQLHSEAWDQLVWWQVRARQAAVATAGM